ncbi:hypothetical protein WJX79_008627 [Trebouxia sp. C0005]
MPTDDVEGQPQRRSASSPHDTSERDWLKQNPDKRALLEAVQTYFLRWKGEGERHPPPPPIYRTVLAWLGSFLSLLLIGGMHQWINTQWSLPLLLSTFGPACALVFGLPTLPASQPMNCMGGNLVGGIVGLFWRVLVGRQAWLAMALSKRAMAMLYSNSSYGNDFPALSSWYHNIAAAVDCCSRKHVPVSVHWQQYNTQLVHPYSPGAQPVAEIH